MSDVNTTSQEENNYSVKHEAPSSPRDKASNNNLESRLEKHIDRQFNSFGQFFQEKIGQVFQVLDHQEMQLKKFAQDTDSRFKDIIQSKSLRTPVSVAVQRDRESIPADGLNTVLQNDPYAKVDVISADDVNNVQDPKLNRRQSSSFFADATNAMSALLLGTSKKNDPPAQNNLVFSSSQAKARSSADSSDDGDYNEDYDEEMEFQGLFGNETNKGSSDMLANNNPAVEENSSTEFNPDDLRGDSTAEFVPLYKKNSAIDFHENIRNIRRTSFTSNAVRKQKSVTLPLQQPAPPPVPPSNPPPPNNNTPPSSNGNTPVPSPSGAGPGFLATVSNAALKSVHYVQTAPSSAHIKLERLHIKAICKFIDDIDEYEIAFHLSLPIPTLIVPTIREQIVSQYGGLTMAKFYMLTKDQIYYILRCECKPTTVLAFILTLQKYVKFDIDKASYSPSINNFKPFYDALLKFHSTFKRYFELMSKDNAVNVPALNGKENGLIKVYIELIPFDYGNRVWRTIKQKGDFNSFKEFENKFFAVISSHYEQYEKSRVVVEHFKVFTSNSFELKKRPNHSVRFKSGLHHIQEVNNTEDTGYHSDVNDHHQVPDSNNEPSSESDSTHEDTHNYQTADEPPSDRTSDDDEAELTEQLHAMMQPSSSKKNNNNGGINNRRPVTNNKPITNSGAPPRSPSSNNSNFSVGSNNRPNSVPNGCFNMLTKGKCSKGNNCTYSHDFAVLQKTCAQYMASFNTSRYNPSNARNPVGNRTLLNNMAAQASDDSA